MTFKDVPRYNDNKTLAIWEVKPGRVGNVAYDITLEETGEREYTVTYHLEHVYRDKTVSVNWVGGDESTRPEIQVQLVSQKGSIYNPVAQGEVITLNAANNYTYTWSGLLEYPKNTAKTDFYPIYGIWEIGEIEGYETAYSVELNGRGSYPFDANGEIVITNTSTAIAVTVNVEGEETVIWVAAEEGKLGEKMPEAPQKAGYEFKGWNTKQNGSGAWITEEDADHGGSDDVCDPLRRSTTDAVDNYKVTIIFDDEDNLAGARPTVLGTVLQNATTKKQLALNAASNKPLKSPTVVTFKDVPRYNDNKTLAIWEVKPGRVGNVAYDITLEETGEREYTVTYHLEHVYRDKDSERKLGRRRREHKTGNPGTAGKPEGKYLQSGGAG